MSDEGIRVTNKQQQDELKRLRALDDTTLRREFVTKSVARRQTWEQVVRVGLSSAQAQLDAQSPAAVQAYLDGDAYWQLCYQVCVERFES